LIGKESGTEWTIDAKGVNIDGEGFVIIEARRYSTSRQNQEKLGALAYRIKDTGASGGIIVSHAGLQKGAEKVAKANNIISVQIDKDSSPESFTIHFPNKFLMKRNPGKLELKGGEANLIYSGDQKKEIT
jgi:hypothetical protein